MMETLGYLVDKVSEFFLYTLPYSRVGGPFNHEQLQEMFKAAQFCEYVGSDELPGTYMHAVQQLQNQFPLLAAGQKLLLSLGDNLKVNNQSMDTARKIHDKQVEDLDSWLYCHQRKKVRDVFLGATAAIKGTNEWDHLRSYMSLLEVARNEDRGLRRMVMERTDRWLGALLVEDSQFIGTQQKIVEHLHVIMSLDKIQDLDKEILATVMSKREDVVGIVTKVVADALNLNETLECIEKVAEVLATFLRLVKHSSLCTFLERLDSVICKRFVKEELTNYLVTKLRVDT